MRRTLNLDPEQPRVPKRLQTPAELSRLALQAQAGNEQAKAELYWRMRPLVYHLSMKLGHGHAGSEDGHTRYSEAEREDMLQQAWVGLAEAVERWDPRHPSGKPFWTVASYRIDMAIKSWQGGHSGAVPLSRFNWEQAWRIQRALEEADVVEWETLTRDELHEVTGIKSAYDVLRARDKKLGHAEEDDLPGSYQSAEEDYLVLQGNEQWADLLQWVRDLEAIDPEHWEDATYWKLEQLGLAGNIEAADIVEHRDELLEMST